MRRAQYYRLCMDQSTTWLRASRDNPSPHMTAGHVALVRLALRHKEETRTRPAVQLLDLLADALPYVTDGADDPANKASGRRRAQNLARRIRGAITEAEKELT